jgi:hypothetical protein
MTQLRLIPQTPRIYHNVGNHPRYVKLRGIFGMGRKKVTIHVLDMSLRGRSPKQSPIPGWRLLRL